MTERKRSILEFAYAHEADDEWSTLAVTSREMLAVERAVKGFTANSFFKDVTVGGLYRIAHVVLRLRGAVDVTTTFDQFVETHDVRFASTEPAQPNEGDDDDDDEVGSEANPTATTA